MKKVFCWSLLVCWLAMTLCSCSNSQVSVSSGIEKITAKRIASAPVELPGGYDVDDFRQLRMGVSGGTIQSNTSAFKKEDVENFMNLRFQEEMAKHRRFKFLALYGADKDKFDTLTEIGEMEANDEDDSPRYQRPDMELTWNINIHEEREPDGSHGQIFRWLCSVDATPSYYANVMTADGSDVKHHKGDLVGHPLKFDLPIIVKRQKLSKSTGRVVEGFNYKSDADVQALMQEIIIAASERIADDLGRRCPVGGRIVAALGMDLLTMDQGGMQGVEKGMEMVVFARYEGVDVPLANATASPAQDKSQLQVWRLSNEKYAKQILQEINGHPMQWMQDTGNELFAVRAVPLQDNATGTRFEQ